jgi:hypothetical protein
MLLFAVLLTSAAAQESASTAQRPADQSRIHRAGIRTLTSQHLTLYTDLPSSPEVDRLPGLFDQAVPQWAEYLGVSDGRTDDWHVEACLIKYRRRFDAAGLMPPAGNDQFAHGLSADNRLWLYDQPTDYYRSHLLLHEGTHAFMAALLGGCGPGWYMEGVAELLATHRLETSKSASKRGQAPRSSAHERDSATASEEPVPFLQLRIMPRSRAEVPMLGRIKLVQDAFAAGHALTLPEVMQTDNTKALENEAYAWCWAAAVFLDLHPRYRDRFRGMQRHVLDRDFNEIFRRQYAIDWSDLMVEWQAFVATLDYGYDFERMAIEFRRGEPLAGKREVTIVADRGWQSSGVWLEAGQTYRISAGGRYQIAEERTADGAKPWPCEPGGATIEYYAGQPLGILLGAIDARTDKPSAESNRERDSDQVARAAEATLAKPTSPIAEATLAKPLAIGLARTVTPTASGTLYLRVNDSAGRLADNQGTLTVTIEPAR